MPTKPTARLYYAAGLIKGFAEQLRGNPKLKAELDKVVSQLQCGETYSAKFALKKNPKNALPIFGARGSLETRFLFIPHEGKLVLIGIIENHRYKASKFFEHPKTLIAAIRKGALKELASLPEFLATIEVSTATVETDGGGAPEPRGGGAEKPLLLQEVYPSHGAWIALSDEQGEVAEKAMLLPAVITGPPGSGKTALLEMLVDMRASLKDEQKPILVVANSAPLANALRAEYQDTHTAPVGGGGSAAKPDTLPVFQSYQDFLGLSTAELVSVDYFVQWLLSPAFPARRAEKEKLNLKPETLYEEMKRLHGLWVQACLSMPEASEEEINQRTYKLYCDFPPTHSYLAKGKNEFFNLIYLPYQTALAHETKKDLHFPDAKAIAHVIRAQADCTAVFADEAQDFGAAAIALLTQAAKNLDAPTAPPALLVCGDDNQNLRGGRFSAIAEIKRQLRLDDTSIHYLSTSFRMAPNITNATQLILAMQQQVRGGAASQYSYTEVSEDKTQKRGNVEWMRVPQKKNLLNWMTSEAGVALEQRLYEEGATILILDVAQREQAQGCFPRCTVKTAEESKGLEMPSIALFSPFGTPKAIALAKLITDRLPKVSSEAPSLAPLLDLVGLRKSKPKAKDKQLSELSDEALDWLSALVVSLSRAKQSCCVISGGVEAHQAHALDKACAEAFKKFTAVVIITKEERIETALTNITQLLNQQDIEGARAHYEEYIGLPGFDKKGTIKAKIFPEPILPEPTASLSQTPPTSPSSGGGRAAPKPKTAEQIGAEKKRKNKQKKLRQKAAKNPKIKKFFEGFERIGKACKLPSPPSKDEREGLMKSILEQLRTISSLEEKAMLKSLINQPSIGANGYTPLHFAASSGNQPLILLLVSLGAQANSKNKEGGTPLHSACQAGQRASVELLLMSGARVDAKSNMGWTPLHSAVSNDNNLEIAKILIKNMPTVNIPDSHGWTPLHLACGGRIWRKSTEIVAALLEKQTNIDVINSEGQTPLHLAAGDFAPPSLVSLLLEAGASTSIQCGQGYTPLIQALEATAFQDYERDLLNVPEAKKTDVLDVKNIDILEVFLTHLLKKKEDVSSILVDKKYGGVLFKTALLRGGPKLLAPFIPYLKDNPHIQEAGLSFIMAHKGNPKDYSSTFYFFLDELFKLENFSTIIMDFIEAPLKNDALSPHILQAFFLRGLSPDACFSSGEHLLLLACRSSLKSIDVILAAGADPNIKTKDYTLLQLAASSAAIPTAKKLLASKKMTSIDARSSFGHTALHKAAKFGTPEMVELLLKNKADPNVLTDTEVPPLGMAIISSTFLQKIRLEVIKKLKKPEEKPFARLLEKIKRKICEHENMEITTSTFAHVHKIKITSESLTNNMVEFCSPQQKVSEFMTIEAAIKKIERKQVAYKQVIDLLIKHSSDLNLGISLLDPAEKMIGSIASTTITSLLNAKANPNIFKQGLTPLHRACQQNKIPLLTPLLENVENVHLKSEEGFSALVYAAQNRSLGIIIGFLKHLSRTGILSQEAIDDVTDAIKSLKGQDGPLASAITTQLEKVIAQSITSSPPAFIPAQQGEASGGGGAPAKKTSRRPGKP